MDKNAVIEYIEGRFTEYINHPAFNNWKLQGEICADACDQKWRQEEQLTRSGFYVGVIAATADGWKDGLQDIFWQANPIVSFRPRKGIEDSTTDIIQNEFSNIWVDCEGLQVWNMLCSDAVNYGMGVGYVTWSKAYADQIVPGIRNTAWGDEIEWKQEFSESLSRPDIARIHPLNYRGDINRGEGLTWEGCEWELSVCDVMYLAGRSGFDKEAIDRVLKRVEKGDFGECSGTYYSPVHSRTGGKKSSGNKLYGKEYWGDLGEIKEFSKFRGVEFNVYILAGEIIKFAVNPIITKRKYRPFKRVRLSPQSDLPFGKNVLSPSIPHQKIRNLMLNLSIDDVIMRQHLGLAVWPDQLQNPNDLLNPEGARGLVFMRSDANPNLLPRFFADSRSGALSDAMQISGEVERDSQLVNLNHSMLGLSGGQQGDTATATRHLANTGSRRLRSGASHASITGLKPMVNHMMLLKLKNDPPPELAGNPKLLLDVINNNVWEINDTVLVDPSVEFTALSQFLQVALNHMMQIAPKDGNMNHVVEAIKDAGRALRISSLKLDKYLPKATPPVDVSQVPQGQNIGQEQIEAPELPPELMGTPAGEMPEVLG